MTAGARERFEILTAGELLAMDLAPLEWIVPGLLPEGTTLLVSPPKIGKSSLVVQIQVALRLGGEVFGQAVEERDALYLALEDGKRRMRDRLVTHLRGRKPTPEQMAQLGIVLDAPKIGEGLEGMLAAWYDDHPRGVVFVDTLQHVRPSTKAGRNAYEADVEHFRRLRDVVRERAGVGLVIVHHTRKLASDDFLAMVSGTHGLAGTADTTITIKRQRHSPEGVIEVTGRDVEEQELAVRYEGMRWDADPDRPLPDRSDRRNEIAVWIRASGGPAWPVEVARGLGMERTNAQALMSSMVEAGDLLKGRAGYDVPFRARPVKS